MNVVQIAGSSPRRGLTRLERRIAILVVAFAALYADVAGQLVEAWSTNYLFSYGFAVPLISGYMIWTNREALKVIPWAPTYQLGVPLVFIGIAMQIVGALGAVNALQQLSLIVTLAGLCLIVFGIAFFRAIWFPVVYLLLMLPLWDQPISSLQIPSQILSARIAVTMLDVVNVPVAREATFIVLPGQTLEVLRECSGVNQLIVVFAMALPAAYLFLRGTWRRVALVVVAVGIAYLSNGFRIALIGVLGQYGYREATRGTLHLVQGLIVSGVGYLAIWAVLSWLGRGASGSPVRPVHEGVPQAAPGSPRRRWVEATVVALLLGAAAYRITFSASPVALVADFGTLPLQIGEWRMDPAAPSAAGDVRLPAMDDEIVRSYRNPAGQQVRLYIGYYRHQESGKELSNAGVRELSAGAQRLAVTASTSGDAGYIRNRKSDLGGVFFWYDVNGRIVDSVYAAKAYTIWDALTRHRTNTAVIVVHWDVARGEAARAAHDVVLGFVQTVLPVLRRSLPS